MKKSRKEKLLSIEKFTLAKLNNPSKIFGGDGATTNDTQTDNGTDMSTLDCLTTHQN
jgi:hypothetical protein